MKVLFWISPVTEMSWPFKRMVWLKTFVPNVLSALRSRAADLDVTTVVSADLMVRARAEGVVPEGHLVELSQAEATDDYRFDELSVTKAYQRGEAEAGAYAHFVRLLQDRLEPGYAPDVVVVLGHAPFLRTIYPAAKVFFHEYSLFSRSPYPTTFALDPFGQAYGFTLSRQAAALASIPAPEDEIRALAEYRQGMLESLRANAAVTAYFEELHKKFPRILLLPLGCDDSADTLVRQSFRTHFELVERVLDAVDADTCVCVTQHPTAPAIPAQRMRELAQIHPNLRSEGWFQSVPRFSQVALAYCDACAYDYTSIAYLAAFLGVRTAALGGFCDGIADVSGFDRLQEVFACEPRPRDNFILWALKHHACTKADMPLQLAAYLDSDFDRAESVEQAVARWPEVLSGSMLIERLRQWLEEIARPFAKELAAIDIAAASKSLADQLKESSRIRSEIWRRLLEREKEVADLTERLESAEKVRGELWKTLQESQSVRSQVWGRLQGVQTERDKLKDELHESQSVRKIIWKRLQESQAVRREIWKRLQESQSVRKLIWVRLQDSEASCTALTNDLAAARAETEAARGETEAVRGEVSELKKNLQESQSVRSTIWGRLEKSNADLESGRKARADLQSERDALAAALEKAKAESNSAIEAERRTLAGVRGELSGVTARRDELQSELEKVVSALSESVDSLDGETRRRQEVEHELAEAERELARTKAARQELEQSMSYRIGRFLTAPARWFTPKGNADGGPDLKV